MATVTIEHFSSLMERDHVPQKKAFGMPSLFVNGNMFLSVMKEGVAYKLSEVPYTEAAPMPIKGWVEIPFSANADWIGLAEQAFEKVAALPTQREETQEKVNFRENG